MRARLVNEGVADVYAEKEFHIEDKLGRQIHHRSL